MKKFCPPSLLITLVMFSYVNLCQAEDIATSISKCGKIMFNGQRLNCYDKIRDGMATQKQPAADSAPNKTQNSSYQPIDFIDLMTDIDTMMQKKIVTSGMLKLSGPGDYAYFFPSASFDSHLEIQGIASLPRETRKLLLQHCTNSCKARVYGTVIRNMGGEATIYVERIDSIK